MIATMTIEARRAAADLAAATVRAAAEAAEHGEWDTLNVRRLNVWDSRQRYAARSRDCYCIRTNPFQRQPRPVLAGEGWHEWVLEASATRRYVARLAVHIDRLNRRRLGGAR